MISPRPRRKRLWLGLPMVALAWLGASLAGWLEGLEDWTEDLRYQLRGPLESEARVYYVNRDAAASEQFGRGWFPREYYAMAGEALLELGGARLVFFDFVFTSDHLPRAQAPALTYEGNLAMQRFLFGAPGRVLMGAAYDGKRHPFAPYPSRLPDRREGDFRLTEKGPRGYGAAHNPLPLLPEFPLWAPPVEDARFPFSGVGRVGLIDTSESLNRGGVVRWVPARVEVDNPFPALHLANGLARWQNTVARLNGLEHRYEAVAEASPPRYLVVDETGRVVNGVPQALPQVYHAAALEMLAMAHPGAVWMEEGKGLVLVGEEAQVVRRLPLRARQHLAVNWYSRWFTGNPELRSAVAHATAAEASDGAPWWDPAQIGKHPEKWVEAVEAGELDATAGLDLWSVPNDPYNPQVSIADVLYLAEAHAVARELGATRAMGVLRGLFAQFEDAFVLVGPTDPMLQDLAPTPFDEDPVPRVSVHGNLLKMLVDDRFLHRLPASFEALAVFGLVALVGGGLLVAGRWGRVLRWGAGLAVGGYLATACLGFAAFDWVLPMASPLGASSSAAVLCIGLQLYTEQREKARLRQLFGTYVSPEVVGLLVDSAEPPQLGGHVREVTAFFSDIEGFSSIAERLPPAELVELMNDYFAGMTEVLVGEQGTLDKYIGDALVGIFGAPLATSDHAARACRAALRMLSRQRELCEQWSDGGRWAGRVTGMRTRIGLHTGEVVIGNMGSPQRFAYTMMGDNVNLAARLEQLGRTYGVELVVSEATRAAAVRSAPELVFRCLDVVAVKGRSQAVRIHELVGVAASIDAAGRAALERYEAALALYLERKWDMAGEAFARCVADELRGDGGRSPARVLKDRCDHYVVHPPPADWDGVFVMKHK